jgi:hypothetical protein
MKTRIQNGILKGERGKNKEGKNMKRLYLCRAFLSFLMVVGLVFILSASASASEKGPDDWNFTFLLYGWLPSIDASATFKNIPPPSGGGTIGSSITASELVKKLNFVFMGAFEAKKGKWGGFTDFMYLDLSDEGTVNVSPAGGPGVPINADNNLKGTVWTLAGEYAAVENPSAQLDIVAGLRYVSMKPEINLKPSGSLPPELPGRNISKRIDVWDGIVGVKGSFALGKGWFLPYYADIGTGESKLTWQMLGGVGYRYKWFDIRGVYRHLDYNIDRDNVDLDLGMSGPAVVLGFHF